MPSSSLIPHHDPTLLLNTAGMVQFKPYFLGEEAPPSPRLASCQKCFRTTDIESVGDSSHCTFFEMLGNFSIGDYFKAEAIDWAWEFVIKHLRLPSEKIWITIFQDDDEAFELWSKKGIAQERIVRLGEKDNFWGPPGQAGPCGPCSELHYDYGLHTGCKKPECNPACDCGRFVEIWNLVFIQFNQEISGQRKPLQRPSIDTGMGLERISAVMQNKYTIFETDLFEPLIAKAAEMAGIKYGTDEDSDTAIRVIAEHGRGISFLIADGVMPDNEGRGYVLRRLIRRAALYGRRLGLKEPFLAQIARITIKNMKAIYPELGEKEKLIIEVIQAEEARFNETLTVGLEMLDDFITAAGSGEKILQGKDVFKLYDTYGFPLELTCEIAQNQGIDLDIKGFEKEMAQQKERARAASQKFKAGKTVNEKMPELSASCFTGYDYLVQKTRVNHILLEGKTSPGANEGQKAALVLENTPFYAEKGGQIGDTGDIKTVAGASFKVTGTIPGPMESIIHEGYVTRGEFTPGDTVIAEVDAARRADIARNHTATHLLHISLKNILGTHVEQRGSFVGPDRLRFDFSHLKPLSARELESIEDSVNEMILSNRPVQAEFLPFREAMRSGAIAIFDEKYGDQVRVLKVGDPPVSSELCGGTHVCNTGEIGLLHIVSESSIGAGLRRIEAVTGREAQRLLRSQTNLIKQASKLLEASPDELMDNLKEKLEEASENSKKLEEVERKSVLSRAESLLARAETKGSVKIISSQLPGVKVDLLRDAADYLKSKLESGIIALASDAGEKPVFVVAVTHDLVKKGYKAGDIIKQISRIAGGGGGGKPELATGGGKDKERIPDALEAVKNCIKVD